jgi:hypothetical protein
MKWEILEASQDMAGVQKNICVKIYVLYLFHKAVSCNSLLSMPKNEYFLHYMTEHMM